MLCLFLGDSSVFKHSSIDPGCSCILEEIICAHLPYPHPSCTACISAFTHDDKHGSKLYGDALAFCSSISLCFYLIASKKVRYSALLCTCCKLVAVFLSSNAIRERDPIGSILLVAVAVHRWKQTLA